MGKSRSSSVVIAYVMLKKKINYEEAFNFVKSKRDCISPNSGFVAQLKEFEEILKVFNYNENLLNYAQKILFMPNDF
jgi:protein-tyrosine phosphatase